MEALEYLKETHRMCSSYKECTDCPLKELASFNGYSTCTGAMFNECEKAVSAVDAWSKENPIITNVMKFKEVFGVLPADYIMGISRETWWDKPYKEPQKK